MRSNIRSRRPGARISSTMNWSDGYIRAGAATSGIDRGYLLLRRLVYCLAMEVFPSLSGLALRLICLGLLMGSVAKGAEKPFGIDHRTPWTTSKIHGTPEPPPPYRTQRTFANLTFKNPLDIAFAPGNPRIFI